MIANRNAFSVVRVVIFVFFIAIIVGYSFFQAQKILFGPIIEVYTPQNGVTYNQTLIEIDGRARNIAYLYLDDSPIFTDKNGYFKEKLLLSPGYNVIKITGIDKFKKQKEVKLQVILKE